MMAQPAVVLVAALIINTLSYCSSENVYCVTPTATSYSSCLHNSIHCATLSEYAQKAELYFTSNTTMVFLPGNHTLDTNITVLNATRLTMCGESSSGNRATVVCKMSVGLSFTSMIDFKIDSLSFTSCNRIGIPPASNYALLLQSTHNVELLNCSFHDNPGTALVVINNINLTLAGKTEFAHNHCDNCVGGGGIAALSSNLTFMGYTTFLENSAALMSEQTLGGGGAIYASGQSLLSFSGTSHFINNSAGGAGGGAIYASGQSLLIFSGTSNFINNSAGGGGDGAIYAQENTALRFKGTNNFVSNSADRGGGAVRLSKSIISILPDTNVYWKNNHANLGGAIYVQDVSPTIYCTLLASYAPKPECFFQLPGQNLSNGIDVQLFFKNNSADDAGSVLYGGAIDYCKLTHGLDSYSSGEVFDELVHIEDDNTNSTISSIPFRIRPCENGYPDYSTSQINRHVHPGETFFVSLGAFGQRNGTVSSAVRSIISTGNLLSAQYSQQANNICTTLAYTVFSLQGGAGSEIAVYADGPCSTFSDKLVIHLTMNQTCPPGFNLSESEQSCVCEPRLQQYTNSCTITNGIGNITRASGQRFWVGFDNQSDVLILHPLCPSDYCVSHTVNFALNNTDIQCANNRAGLLCGACKPGYSLVLSTSHCRQCTNSYLALLIPFVLMGLALVFLLFVCKLTVAKGTLSGLLFYANIVGANRNIFLPVDSTDLFSVFIAWLNLDFGIETCFYNGMDAYSKTWLQFVFNVFVLIQLIFFARCFSVKFEKLLGIDPVSVLATLIFLAYTNILRTLTVALSSTGLEYPNYMRRVWLQDADLEFFVGKHIPLGIVAILVFFFLFLPYTLLLFCDQWLLAISHLKLFSWVNSPRLKPFMDAYHAPYKAKHRYWPGLLLVLRFVLLLVFALNTQQDPSVNLLAILVGTGFLQMWARTSGGVYRNWCLDALESSFALNLIILTAATYHVNLSRGNQYAVWCTSVSIALATFIGILAYHSFQQLRSTKLWKMVPKLNLKRNKLNTTQTVNNPAVNVADFSRLRESLLEDLPQPKI